MSLPSDPDSIACSIILLPLTAPTWLCSRSTLGINPCAVSPNLVRGILKPFNVHQSTIAELRDSLMYNDQTIRVVCLKLQVM